MSNPSRPDVGSPTRYVVLGLALTAVVVLVARYGGYGGQAPESALPALNAGLNAISTIRRIFQRQLNTFYGVLNMDKCSGLAATTIHGEWKINSGLH